ncbi:Sec-independent protein translocase, TatC subunit [Paenibacillus curdlanolyticus YK9]|uniref:Sec-independent protein translocase protein TatC n=1 Tax=Paenibacillus curdlanolyticus YK9 TaxID=717606 RepID=E0I647_9BACL|nr:twin-arginine translocase subunit TatC [Paenibacillus curdlanolyticus]EFM12439.1 Sec-independent protein translocase, TatC subunit [Paenibacillus curdlanolyticus YK9]
MSDHDRRQEDLIKHLTELRRRLIVTFSVFVVTLCVGLYLSPSLLRYLKAQPAARGVEWNVFSFTDGLFVYLRCAFLFAVILTLPLVLYQAWAFARPGLTETEAKGTLSYIPASFALFVGGISFSYFVVFPMMLRFMQRMNVSVGAVETYGIDKYFGFMFNVIFPLGIAFEMPLVILFMTRIGLLTPEKLRTSRKYAYVALAVVGSCISPPDFVSHLSVTIPLLLLYESGVFVSSRAYGKRRQSLMPSPQ